MILIRSISMLKCVSISQVATSLFSQIHWDRPPDSNLIKNIENSIRDKTRLPIQNKSLRKQKTVTFLESSINFTSINLSSFPDNFQRVWLPDNLNDLNPTFLESMHIIPSHYIPRDRNDKLVFFDIFIHLVRKIQNLFLHFAIRIKLWFMSQQILKSEDAKVIFHKFIYSLSSSDWKSLENICSLDLIPHLKKLYSPYRATTHWTVIKHILEPYLHSIRIARISRDNQFLQIIYQFSSEQILTKYSSSGRVLIGDQIKSENIIDYIVFEKVINFPYSSWKIMDRVGGFDKSLLSFKHLQQLDFTIK